MSANTDDAVASIRENAADRMRDQQEEVLELEGVARELFVERYEDTFSIEIHGKDIEFYRPLDASSVDLGDVDGGTAERIQRGSRLLDEFEERQEQVMRAANSGDVNLGDLLDESMDAVELQAKILAAHAVDDSLTRPEVWQAMFRNDDRLNSVFEDFFLEGESEQTREKLDALDGMLSGSSSTN